MSAPGHERNKEKNKLFREKKGRIFLRNVRVNQNVKVRVI
jgi:hypothetical protein